MAAYRILVPLQKSDPLVDLVTLAGHLLPEAGGQIDLMGVVSVPPGHSLSEAATPAQETREALASLASRFPDLPLFVKPRVRVAHVPWLDVLSELLDEPVDLLLAPWNAGEPTILGATPQELLGRAPCDLILCRGMARRYDRVLLPVRGGPHLGLMLRLAGALGHITGEESTLLAVSGQEGRGAALERLKEKLTFRARIVSERGDPVSVIRRLAADYHALILGATLPRGERGGALGRIPTDLLQHTPLPIFLVRSFHPAAMDIPAAVAPSEPESGVSDLVERWFATNTFHWREFEDVEGLIRCKQAQGQTISLVLPALNEEATIGQLITTIKTALLDEFPLLDEMVLMDSGSTDGTREIAASLGLPVYIHPQVLASEVGSHPGKGEALWKSLYVTRGDIVAWIDTDTVNVHPRFVLGIIGPLLRWNRIQYVKGFYRRPLRVGGQVRLAGGGRVTELVARPLINLFFPELSGIIQPLSGEYAGRRAALEGLPFFTGYGVESGLLVDFWRRFGLAAIAQCDLEMRTQKHQPLANLSKMAFAVMQVFCSRLESRSGEAVLKEARRTMKIICHEPGRFDLQEEEVTEHERPPMATVRAYREKLGRVGEDAAPE